MHPKAAYCALLGLRLMRLRRDAHGTYKGTYRIRYHRSDNEMHLCMSVMYSINTWTVCKAAAITDYEESIWDDIHDEDLDTLPGELIEELRKYEP